MTKPEPNATTESTAAPVNFLHHVMNSAMATAASQPARVLLNRAKLYSNPFATMTGSYPYFLTGLGINVLRGSLATGMQSWAKHKVQEQYGLMPAIMAASLCGAGVATFVETPYIRMTTMEHLPGAKYSLWRFSPALSSCYYLREVGFTLAVLAKKDLSPAGQWGALLVSAWVTATLHKMAVMGAIGDSMERHGSLPKYSDGMFTTIRNIATGGTYTHPEFAVPFKNPVSFLAKVGNLMHVSCGVNMFVFRLLYLATFGQAYSYATETSPSLLKRMSFFKEPKPDEPGRLQSGEDHNNPHKP